MKVASGGQRERRLEFQDVVRLERDPSWLGPCGEPTSETIEVLPRTALGGKSKALDCTEHRVIERHEVVLGRYFAG
jgi:hypothetical protein